MKINIKNTDAVEKLLLEKNGRATAHVYQWAFQVRSAMATVEENLTDFGLVKKHWRGCVAVITSGDKLPNAYKYMPIRTELRIEAFPSGWFITGIRVFQQTDYRPVITLSNEQINSARESKMRMFGIRQSNQTLKSGI